MPKSIQRSAVLAITAALGLAHSAMAASPLLIGL